MNNEEKILSVLESLVTKVDGLDTRMDRMETRIDQIESRLETLENDVSTLKTDVAVLKTDVAEMKDTLNAVFDQTVFLTEFRTDITQKLDTNVAVTKENTYAIALMQAKQMAQSA